MLLSHYLCALACTGAASLAAANVEKLIFIAPEEISIPAEPPTISSLGLEKLMHDERTVRTHVAATFPDKPPNNSNTLWMVLDDLSANQRYELRVCWAATQPTSLRLDAFELDTVWETPELIGSLAEFSASIQDKPFRGGLPEPRIHDKYDHGVAKERHSSILLLRVIAVTDFFADDPGIMSEATSVHIDLILDPYFLGLVPKSLLATVGYTVLVAVLAWAAGGYLAALTQSVAWPRASEPKKNL